MTKHREALERYTAKETEKLRNKCSALIAPIVLGVPFMIDLFALVWFSPSSGD